MPPTTTAIYTLSGLEQIAPFQLTRGISNVQPVDGLHYRAGWSQHEASEGVYNWTSISNAVSAASAAGEKISISLTPGTHTPIWVYNAGAASYSTIGPGGFAAKYPLPWDTVYQAKFATFIQQFKVRFGARTFHHITLTGINAFTEEVLIPAGNALPGYSNTLIESAWNWCLKLWAGHFPCLLVGMHGRSFLPAPDDTVNLIQIAQSMLGSQYVMQNNGVNNIRSSWWPYIDTYLGSTSPSPALGLQEGSAIGFDAVPCLTLAQQAGAAWLEVYPNDLQYL